MNLKNGLIITAFATTLAVGVTPTKGKCEEITQDTKNKTCNTLCEVIKEPSKEICTETSNATKEEDIENSIKEIMDNYNGIETIEINSMEGGPLDMKGIHKKGHISQFLGISQWHEILKNYNKEYILDDNGDISDDLILYKGRKIDLPRIYPSLIQEFPENLEEYLKNNKFRSELGGESDLLVIKKAKTGKFIAGMYLNGKLFLATHISPGIKSKGYTKKYIDKNTGEEKEKYYSGGVNTPEGVFEITKSEGLRYKRSWSYGQAPMPYSLHIFKGVYMHHGPNADGNKRSHGCIRVPGFYQQLIYKKAYSGLKILIQETD